MSTSSTVRLDLSEVDALAIDYARGDRSAASREALIRAGLPFACRLARRYRGRGEPADDLEQVARVGLLKAVDRYDSERGVFSGFAAVTIMGELRRHFRDRTWGLHVPRGMQEMSLNVGRVTAELTAELRRAPTAAEVATRLDVDEQEVRQALETATAYSPMSLNRPARLDGSVEVGDLVGRVDEDLEAVDDRMTVSALLARIPERERRILALRFYGNHTQAEIAAELGVSQMHVSRLLSRALSWLREAMMSDAPQYWQVSHLPSDQHELTVRVHDRAGPLRLEVVGEVDRDTADTLRAALLAALARPVPEVRVSLAGVPLIDATGIAVLKAGHEAARAKGIRLRIDAAQPYVMRSLRVTGLDHLLSDR